MRSRVAARVISLALAGGMLMAACTSDDVSVDPITGDDASSPAASPSAAEPSGRPRDDGLALVVRDEYVEGSRIKVRLRNETSEPFIYNTQYEACDMTYLDASGREFLVPPGTHCDIIAPDAVEPGSTVTLFTWKLDECVKDEWGCQKERPLVPGTYTVRGSFEGADSGDRVRVEASFRIVAGLPDPAPSVSPTTGDSRPRSPGGDDGGGGGAERRT